MSRLTCDELLEIIREQIGRNVGQLPGETTYTLLCPAHLSPAHLSPAHLSPAHLSPAHLSPEGMYLELAEYIEEELYWRSLRGRIADRWFRVRRHLPHWLVLALSAEERCLYCDHKRDRREGGVPWGPLS